MANTRGYRVPGPLDYPDVREWLDRLATDVATDMTGRDAQAQTNAAAAASAQSTAVSALSKANAAAASAALAGDRASTASATANAATLTANATRDAVELLDGENLAATVAAAEDAATRATAAAEAAVAPTDTAVEYVITTAGTASQAAVAEVAAGAIGSARLAHLDIPTFDGNPDVGHPSVIHVPGGFAGYEYWMAYTPYPDRFREDPCVVASTDGVDWVVPAGLVNPLYDRAWALGLGYDYNSDTEIVLSPDKAELWVYWRAAEGTKHETIFRTTSTDGVIWSAPVAVLDTTERTAEAYMAAMSPAVIVEDDGTLTMWTTRNPNVTNTQKILRRTSPDGVTWSADTAVTINLGAGVTMPVPWHLAVRKIAGRYYMLLDVHLTWKLLWLVSDDGITWTMDGRGVGKSGASWDRRGYYRSTFTASPTGGTGTIDLYLNGMDGRGPAHYNDAWRIGVRQGVALPGAGTKAARIFRGAEELGLSPNTTTPVRTHMMARLPAISLAANEASAGGVVGTFYLPEGTVSVEVRVHWASLAAGAGSVTWAASTWALTDGGASSAVATTNKTLAALAQDIPQASLLHTATVAAGERLLWVKVGRNGPDVNDTLTAAAGVLGISVQPIVK